MKKVLGGCLIVGLLLLAVGGGATWWFVLRPAWNAGSSFINAATQVAELGKMDGQVRKRGDFSPPADGRISDRDLARFIAVQQVIRDGVGTDLGAIEARYKQIAADAKADGKTLGPTDILNAYGEIFGLVRSAKQAQIEGLNQQGFSLAEYRWMRGQVQSELIRDATRSNDTEASELARRLEPHRELLQQTVVMGVLGL